VNIEEVLEDKKAKGHGRRRTCIRIETEEKKAGQARKRSSEEKERRRREKKKKWS